MGITIKTDKPCSVFAEVIEQAAIDQFESAMAQDCVTRGALMPDAHAGYTLPIGSVIETKGMIFPSWVGYDIGCGMCALATTFDKDAVAKNSKMIFDAIYKAVPVGFSHNALPVKWDGWEDRRQTDKMREVFSKNGLQQLGTLGGGNHFIEIGADEKGVVWIVTHSGSRGIGHAIASHYMRMASGDGRAREGHFGFSVESPNGLNYIEDLSFCLDFALANRREIIRRVELVIKEYSSGSGHWDQLINRNHNHAEERNGLWIHRKGATHAEDGMMGVIPGNMRDGSFIVRGKGNPSALFSSSHGAGRVMGRKEAQRVLSAESFAKEMIGIEAKVTAETLDESPSVYKDIFAVMEQQKDLVDVIAHEKPIINIKG